MKNKYILVQLGFVAVATPLLILLFHFVAQEIAPAFYSEALSCIENGTHARQEILRAYKQFSQLSIYAGIIAGIIVGRAAYYLYRDR